MAVSRPGKLSHCQTILYEMDMFRHSASRLAQDKWENEMDKWVYLEAFLLHFRNLIEFFAASGRGDTLSIQRPDLFWPNPNNRPAEEDLRQLHRPDLWEKYEDNNNPEKISRYLQHCTEQRVERKEWKIGEMSHELYTLMEKFEQLLTDKSRNWALPVTQILLGPESAGTNTVVKRSWPPREGA